MKYFRTLLKSYKIPAGIVLGLTLILACNSSETQNPEQKIVARINSFELSLAEYENRLVREMEFDAQYKTTDAARKKFLDTLIKKEILIQEAVRQGLDRNKDFVRAIENYWEATLIKQLMETKSRQISQQVTVTDEEIRAHYKSLKNKKEDIPALETIEKEIAAVLKDKKQARMLESWMQQLEKSANIQVNLQNLKY